ncbi:MAG: CDP-glucose 4,6-dehydratase [Bacteroidetes bacterium 47-18]|nr:MAG: CDP-glucose 4,6-dehydratase [Bacteroidetes bacterium 47-18]
MEHSVQRLKSFFENKRVVLTGHTGFKGAWMLQVLSCLGAEVKGIALEPESGADLISRLNVEALCYSSVTGDIRDANLVNGEISRFQPDIVIHFAAQSLVRRSYAAPVETFATNVMGTVHVLEAIRHLKKDCLGLMITTDKVYENNEAGRAFTETDKLGGYDPYSASKAACEIAIGSYRNSFMNPEAYEQHGKVITSVRAGNVIGGGDFSADRIIPDIVRAIQKNEPVVLRNPGAVRPWQHVLEPVFAYLCLLMEMSARPRELATAFNIGPEPADTLTVEAVTQMFIRAFGKGSYTILRQAGQPHEAGLLTLDNSKLKKAISWQPKWNAGQAISYTAEWYARAGELPVGDLCKSQIEAYLGESL